MEREERQQLVDQRAANAQTVQFVADREAEVASQIDGMRKEHPELSSTAALEREHRNQLMELARDEKNLATAIQFEAASNGQIAAAEREHRKDLLEIAGSEERLADEFQAIEGDDSTVKVLAEQADRNADLLRHLAQTQSDADRALRAEESGSS